MDDLTKIGWKVLKVVGISKNVIYSVPQASFCRKERGSNININVIEINMLEKTVMAQRIICDGISSLLSEEQGNISKVTINHEIIKYCINVRNKYCNFLDDIIDIAIS